MRIRGAILEEIGAARPYSKSTPIRIAELELAGPAAGELLVEVEAASICHSDLSVVDGSRPRPVPMLLGHEAAGRVIELGSGIDDLTLGQRVIMTFLPRCGACAGCHTDGRAPCVPGSEANAAGELMAGGTRLAEAGSAIAHHLGVSGFASHAVVDRRSVVPVDDAVPPQVAALFGCAVLTGGGAVLNVARPRPGSMLVIVGLGGVGLAAALTALAHDDVHVIGIDALPAKLELARSLGVHEALTPAQATERGLQAAAVIEAVGKASVFAFAMSLTAPGGTTITVGLPAATDTIEFAPLGLVARGQSIVGSYLGSAVPARDIPALIGLWRAGRLPVERLITATIGLDEINHAMDALADGAELRQVITFT